MKKQKMVLYCRASSHDQLILQEERLRCYTEENSGEVIGVVFDRRTGKHTKRLKLQWALHLARKHNAMLVVADLSRISRRVSESIKFANQLKRRGVDLVSVSNRNAEDQTGYMLTTGYLLKQVIAHSKT